MSHSVKVLLIILAAVAAVFGANARIAHADPSDTVGVQAAIVCATLASSPTVDTIDAEVARLNATYTEASENKVMYYAMNTLCPQYQYLAIASLRNRLAQIQQGAVV